MLPNFVYDHACQCIRRACCGEMKLLTPQPPTEDEMATFIANYNSYDLETMERAAALYPDLRHERQYYGAADKDDFGYSITFIAAKSDKYLWPLSALGHPNQLPRDHKIHKNLMEVIDYWTDVQKKWTLVMGMLEMLNNTGQPVSVLKHLWPDFTILFDLPTSRVDLPARRWASETWANLGQPRSPDSEVPNAMELLEDIRRTVLTMAFYPGEASWDMGSGGKVNVNMVSQKGIRMPWYMLEGPRYPDDTVMSWAWT